MNFWGGGKFKVFSLTYCTRPNLIIENNSLPSAHGRKKKFRNDLGCDSGFPAPSSSRGSLSTLRDSSSSRSITLSSPPVIKCLANYNKHSPQFHQNYEIPAYLPSWDPSKRFIILTEVDKRFKNILKTAQKVIQANFPSS